MGTQDDLLGLMKATYLIADEAPLRKKVEAIMKHGHFATEGRITNGERCRTRVMRRRA
jgi:hypothetical protein